MPVGVARRGHLRPGSLRPAIFGWLGKPRGLQVSPALRLLRLGGLELGACPGRGHKIATIVPTSILGVQVVQGERMLRRVPNPPKTHWAFTNAAPTQQFQPHQERRLRDSLSWGTGKI